MKTVSIGFMRDDGDFQLLATLNNNDETLHEDAIAWLAIELRESLQKALTDDYRHELVEVVERQDAPDYVVLDEADCKGDER